MNVETMNNKAEKPEWKDEDLGGGGSCALLKCYYQNPRTSTLILISISASSSQTDSNSDKQVCDFSTKCTSPLGPSQRVPCMFCCTELRSSVGNLIGLSAPRNETHENGIVNVFSQSVLLKENQFHFIRGGPCPFSLSIHIPLEAIPSPLTLIGFIFRLHGYHTASSTPYAFRNLIYFLIYSPFADNHLHEAHHQRD